MNLRVSRVNYLLPGATGVLVVAGVLSSLARGVAGLWLYLLIQALVLLAAGLPEGRLLGWLFPGLVAGVVSARLDGLAARHPRRSRHGFTGTWLAAAGVGLVLGAVTRPGLGMTVGGALAGLPVWNLVRRWGMGSLALRLAGPGLRLAAALLAGLQAAHLVGW